MLFAKIGEVKYHLSFLSQPQRAAGILDSKEIVIKAVIREFCSEALSQFLTFGLARARLTS